MNTQTFIVIIVFHLFLSAIVLFCIKANLLKFSSQLYPLILFIPVWGLCLAFYAEYATRKNLTGSKEISLEELQTDDYRIISIKQDTSSSSVVPLEEAIVINDTDLRRQLMVEILHQDPNQYIRLLQQARSNDDIEVTHYASTAMMEAQRGHELELQKCEKRLAAEPDNVEALDDAILAFKRYINSGLIEETMLKIERTRFTSLLQQKIETSPTYKSTYFDLADNYLELNDFGSALAIIDTILSRWPEDENAWQLKLKYCHTTNNGNLLKTTIHEMEQKNVYLSEDGRKAFEFWRGTAEREEL